MRKDITVFLFPLSFYIKLCLCMYINILSVYTNSVSSINSESVFDIEEITHTEGYLEYLLYTENTQNISDVPTELSDGSGYNEIKTEETKFENSNTSSCREPGSKKLCSGHGSCSEGRCECYEYDFIDDESNVTNVYKYSGKYCEECPYCRGQRCENFLPCIICRLIENGDHCSICPDYYSEVEDVRINITNDDKMCDMEYFRGCFVEFKYYYKHQQVYLEVKKSTHCFHGGVYLFYIYWTLVFSLILLLAVTPKLCFMRNQPEKTAVQRQLSTIRRRRYLYSEIRPGSFHECSV